MEFLSTRFPVDEVASHTFASHAQLAIDKCFGMPLSFASTLKYMELLAFCLEKSVSQQHFLSLCATRWSPKFGKKYWGLNMTVAEFITRFRSANEDKSNLKAKQHDQVWCLVACISPKSIVARHFTSAYMAELRHSPPSTNGLSVNAMQTACSGYFSSALNQTIHMYSEDCEQDQAQSSELSIKQSKKRARYARRNDGAMRLGNHVSEDQRAAYWLSGDQTGNHTWESVIRQSQGLAPSRPTPGSFEQPDSRLVAIFQAYSSEISTSDKTFSILARPEPQLPQYPGDDPKLPYDVPELESRQLSGSDFGVTPPDTPIHAITNGVECVTNYASCPICMEDVSSDKEVLFLPCGHWYHHLCLYNWLEENSTCPSCRGEVGELIDKINVNRRSRLLWSWDHDDYELAEVAQRRFRAAQQSWMSYYQRRCKDLTEGRALHFSQAKLWETKYRHCNTLEAASAFLLAIQSRLWAQSQIVFGDTGIIGSLAGLPSPWDRECYEVVLTDRKHHDALINAIRQLKEEATQVMREVEIAVNMVATQLYFGVAPIEIVRFTNNCTILRTSLNGICELMDYWGLTIQLHHTVEEEVRVDSDPEEDQFEYRHDHSNEDQHAVWDYGNSQDVYLNAANMANTV